jgi:hypothetical protein
MTKTEMAWKVEGMSSASRRRVWGYLGTRSSRRGDSPTVEILRKCAGGDDPIRPAIASAAQWRLQSNILTAVVSSGAWCAGTIRSGATQGRKSENERSDHDSN